MAFLRRFWAYFGSLAGLVGLYFGADAADAVWAFWLVLALALIVAGGPLAGRRVVELVIRARNYPKLLGRLQAAEEERSKLQQRLAIAEEDSTKRAARLRDDGRREVVGAILSGLVRSTPHLRGISLDAKGLIFVADGTGIAIGTRFTLVVATTGDVRGHLEVVDHRGPEKDLRLRCVERTSPEFWAKLEERAISDASPPQGFALTRYQPEGLTLPLELQPPDTEGSIG